MSNELTTFEKNNFQLAEIDSDFPAIIAEEMEGLGQMPFETVKIPSGGGIAFEVPGDNDDTPDVAQDITGIIVVHHALNACWMDAYEGGNTPPDCASLDGKIGTRTSDGEAVNCATCPYNQFGSSGNGKLCKNMHRLYILRSGDIMPIRLNLPPTSISAWKNYLAKRIVLKGKYAWQVLTKVTLKKEKNADGIAYSQAVFTKLADLTPAECAHIKPMVDGFKIMTSVQAMQGITNPETSNPADVSASDWEDSSDNPFFK